MKRLTIAALLLVIAGCGGPPPYDELMALDYGSPPGEEYQQVIMGYFNGVLIDPMSAVYDFWEPAMAWCKPGTVLDRRLTGGYAVKVAVNAKNRMGGYTGRKFYCAFFIDGELMYVFSDYNRWGYVQ